MPGRPHDVGAQERALVEEAIQLDVGGAGQTLGERPLGPAIVLRLDRAEPADGVSGGGEGIAQQALRAEAAGGDLGHALKFCGQGCL